MRSYDLVPGKKQIRIEAGMRHSHVHGWAPAEIGLFIDQHINNGTKLPRLGAPTVTKGKASVAVTAVTPLKQAELVWTTDSGPLVKRRWQRNSATLSADRRSIVATIPDDATIWLMTASDSRGAMVSTPAVFNSQEKN